MSERAVAKLLVAAVLAVTGVGCTSDADEPFDSGLPTDVVVVPDGPAYVLGHLGGGEPKWEVASDGSSVRLGKADVVVWLPDGRLLAQRSTYEQYGRDRGRTGSHLQVLDPTSGEVRDEASLGSELVDWGVTPEAVTVRSGNRLVVRDLDLTEVESIQVKDTAVDTDQLEGRAGAEFALHHTPYTLDGVTWVQWGLSGDFDDALTDHGVLRIEDGQPEEVLRNEPIVDLLPSTDGSALLALMQDNGEDANCGGCLVEQKLVELDPDNGEIAADYGMPEGYDRSWRIEQVDKEGSTVVVRFNVAPPDRGTEGAISPQTWTYDDGWTHLADLDGTRTWWQPGGRLVQTPKPGALESTEGVNFQLRWVPDDGEPVELFGPGDSCPVRPGGILCPLLSAPGSIIPPA